MRHVDGRDREPALQVPNFLSHLDAQLGVEVRQRLVEQQHARLDDDRARQRDALLLAARELAGKLLLVAGEADQREHLADALCDHVVAAVRARASP